VLVAEEMDLPLKGRSQPELVQRKKLFVDECSMFEIFFPRGFGAGGSVVSFVDAGKKLTRTRADGDSGTNGVRGIDSDAVTRVSAESIKRTQRT